MPATSLDGTVSSPATPASLMKQVFGFGEFRAGQQEAITKLLEGRSVLAIFPTGSGKSLCYQLPALMIDGLTIVISPLIALMKDQIDFLRARNVAAARLDSSLTRDETIQVYDDMRSGRLRMLYVSPERLGNERFLGDMARQKIGLLAVDEAHCISQWGHNFRPDYLKIAALADQLRVARVLALTATATPQVAADIACSFHIDQGDIVQTGFYRPNLELHVSPCTQDNREKLLVGRLSERPRGPTVVYVTLQRTAERVAALLASRGFWARPYHAGLATEERTEIQDEFMAADDMIVVATIAFGMGIDKSNIRAVYHYNLPKGLESYMQEIGRAGRDGEPAICEMLACADDVVTLEYFAYGDTPARESIATIIDELFDKGAEFDVSIYELAHRHDLRDLVVKTLFTYLELDGLLQSTGPFYSEFKFQPLRRSQEILAQFDPQRAAFLRAVFKSARPGKTWFSLDADEVARSLGEPRGRIVTALDFLEQQGDLLVQATGVRHGFRVVRTPRDLCELASTFVAKFSDREQQEIERIRQVVAFAEHPRCLTQHLLAHFGEERDECGHCDRCLGTKASRLPPPTYRALTQQDQSVIRTLQAQRHVALASSRQLARFLCGISSPATTRAKLRAHDEFGRLEGIPFAEVLELIESANS